MTSFECVSSNEKLRVALYSDIITMCKETNYHLGLDISKPAMLIIAELVYKKLSIYVSDLESFANHAKRNSIQPEDVKLLVRRNPSLTAHLHSKCPDKVNKRRKTVSSVTTSKKRRIDNNLPSNSRDCTSPIL